MSDTRTLVTVRDTDVSDKASNPLAALKPSGRKPNRTQAMLGDQRLIRLRRAVVDGDYQVDPQRIAVKLLKRS